MPQKRTIDMTEIFTDEGRAKLKKGELLRFNQDGRIVDYIITSLANNRVRVRRTTTYTPEELEAKSQRAADAAAVDKANGELSEQGVEL